MTEDLLVRVTDAVVSAVSAEELVRPLLVLLQEATGLDAAYVTQIDWQAGTQQVLYVHNTERMAMPEGFRVPWDETLCKRALEEDSPYVEDAARRWPDVSAARALGIRAYASAPIGLADGSVFGTLCAIGQQRKAVSAQSRQLFRLFAALIGKYAEREQMLRQLQQANVELEAHAQTDALTRLPNRRATLIELRRLFPLAVRERRSVLVAFIDLDGFKRINDTHGHDVGDDFLVEIGRRLSGGLRSGDWLGRLGGDEFVVAGLGPVVEADSRPAIAALRGRLAPWTQGRFHLGGLDLDYEGASFGIVCVDPATTTVEEALRVADAAMYLDKRGRREPRSSAGPDPAFQ